MDVLRVDDRLTDEERMVRDTVRAFVTEKVAPHVAAGSRTGRSPPANWPPSWARSACSACI